MDSRYNKLLGPSEITLLYQKKNISGLQNNKIQRNFELWDQENYFVISDFVISVFFITRVHCIGLLKRIHKRVVIYYMTQCPSSSMLVYWISCVCVCLCVCVCVCAC